MYMVEVVWRPAWEVVYRLAWQREAGNDRLGIDHADLKGNMVRFELNR